jgi:predicted nucleic-acid-binding protein
VTGLDTNILVRFIAQDDPAKNAIANSIISRLSAEEPGWISTTAIAKLAWVLDRRYGMTTPVIYTVLSQLLTMPEIVIERADLVREAADLFSKGGADFTDYLIACAGQAAGCEHTLTFDKKAAKSAGMILAR